MSLRWAGALLGLLAAAIVAVWWATGAEMAGPVALPAEMAEEQAPESGPGGPLTAGARREPASARRDDRPPAEAPVRAAPTPGTPQGETKPGPPAWPSPRVKRDGGPAPQSVGEPAVPIRLAFRALWYLGVDPEAEKTWSRAINDPKTPPGVRRDLIVDMIDEGYSDNDHPTRQDLPTILARLEIIERYAPYAMDEVNAAAFEEAYRVLLDLYIRLGGEPRKPR